MWAEKLSFVFQIDIPSLEIILSAILKDKSCSSQTDYGVSNCHLPCSCCSRWIKLQACNLTQRAWSFTRFNYSTGRSKRRKNYPISSRLVGDKETCEAPWRLWKSSTLLIDPSQTPLIALNWVDIFSGESFHSWGITQNINTDTFCVCGARLMIYLVTCNSFEKHQAFQTALNGCL